MFPTPSAAAPPRLLFANPQAEFLQRHALATSVSFGPLSGGDAVAVLNHPGFAGRNGALLQQLQHLELSAQLDLSPYTGEARGLGGDGLLGLQRLGPPWCLPSSLPLFV